MGPKNVYFCENSITSSNSHHTNTIHEPRKHSIHLIYWGVWDDLISIDGRESKFVVFSGSLSSNTIIACPANELLDAVSIPLREPIQHSVPEPDTTDWVETCFVDEMRQHSSLKVFASHEPTSVTDIRNFYSVMPSPTTMPIGFSSNDRDVERVNSVYRSIVDFWVNLFVARIETMLHVCSRHRTAIERSGSKFH